MQGGEELNATASSSSAADSAQLDWDALRQLSLRPGGFRERRTELWPKLLHVRLPPAGGAESLASNSGPPAVEPHPDERQVRLDTDRSFVLYPVVGDMKERERRQNELHDLIVEVFRKRRKLNYFQGYHDIISVLFLTLPKELQFHAAEKLSLHRLRDSMGSGLEPVIGLLRVLKRVLDHEDREYSDSLNTTGKMPFFALSNLLTLFSHDMPTLPLIQHVFDYLLCRHPLAVVYLAAAILLSRKAEVQRLQEEDEDGMIHSLLSSLPDIYDEDEDRKGSSAPAEPAIVVHEQSTAPALEQEAASPVPEESSSPRPNDDAHDDLLSESESDVSSQADDATLVDESSHTSELDMTTPSVLEDDPTLVSEEIHKTSTHLQESSTATAGSFHTAPEAADPPESAPLDEAASVLVHSPEWSPRFEAVAAPPEEAPARRPRIHLSELLRHADELLARHPPAEVGLEEIMGPNSVMRTWSEDPALLPSDDAAELMVASPHLIVLPPPVEEDEEKVKEEEAEEATEKRTARKPRRRLRKPVRIGSVLVERNVVIGAAVVLGVAMAMYGFQATPQRHHSQHAGRELLRVCKFLGGAMVGFGGRLLDGVAEMTNVMNT